MTHLLEETVRGVTVLRVSGNVTLAGLSAIEPRFDAIARGGGPLRVVADLRGVSAVSTPGITLMLRTGRAVAARGGVMIFAAAAPPVRAVFTCCRLDLVLNIMTDVDEAVEAAEAFAPDAAPPRAGFKPVAARAVAN